MKLALIQSTVHADKAENIARHVALIADAAAEGAQVICLQELFATPYFCRVQDAAKFDLAEFSTGPTYERIREVARETNTVVVCPFFEKGGSGVYYNSASVIGPDGFIVGTYRKQHIPQDPGFEEKFYFTPGEAGQQNVFPTPYGKLGLLICWDQWFPEAARLTALAGADVILYPTAIGWQPAEKKALGQAQYTAWETVQRGHAVANGCYLAAVNRTGAEGRADAAGGEIEFWGQSFVANPYGEIIAQAPVGESHILIAEIDLRANEAFRRAWPFFRDRRIDAYAKLQARSVD